MKKTIATILAVLTVVSLVSCYKTKKTDDKDINSGENVTPVVQTDNSKEQTEEKPEKKPAEKTEKADEKTAEIIYNGRVDMNFIEVSFDEGEYGIMQLSDEVKESFDSASIAEGAKLEVTYTEKDGQKIITGIK